MEDTKEGGTLIFSHAALHYLADYHKCIQIPPQQIISKQKSQNCKTLMEDKELPTMQSVTFSLAFSDAYNSNYH